MKKIFLLGDSISIHYGPFLTLYLPEDTSIERKSGAEEFLIGDEIVRKDDNGGDSRMVLKYLELGQKEIKADILLVNSGLHDIKTDKAEGKINVSKEEYKENIKKIVDQGRKMARDLVWITTVPINQDTHNSLNAEFDRFEQDLREYNEIAVGVMKDKKVPTIDLYDLTNNFDLQEILEDHVHFKEGFRKIQAAFIAGWLSSFTTR